MLNEAWRVWQALRNAGIETELPHPLIKPLPLSFPLPTSSSRTVLPDSSRPVASSRKARSAI